MATTSIGVTEAANFIPELWSEAILDYAERKFRLRNILTDASGFLPAGLMKGDTIHVPRVTEETAQQKGEDTAVTFTGNVDDKTDITIDQLWYSAKRIESIAQIQANADLFVTYVRPMGYSLAKKFENFCALILQTATAHDVTLTTDNQVTAAKYREGLQNLGDYGVEIDTHDMYMFASPAAYYYMLGLGDFTEYTKTGVAPSGYVTGLMPVTYGAPTFQSTDWDDDGGTGDETASLFTSESILFAIQKDVTAEGVRNIQHIADELVIWMLFGASITQTIADTAGQIANYNNP